MQKHGKYDASFKDTDGKEALLRPRNFPIAIAYRLGVPVGSRNPLPLCKQPINIFGDHATCCAKKGDVIIRHNSLRNLIDSIGTDALLSPVMEKKGIGQSWRCDISAVGLKARLW